MSLAIETASGARPMGIHDRRVREVALLRQLLLRPRPEDREFFARDCLRYSRAYLQRNWHRWASGFESGYAFALAGAADMAVALLLRQEEEPYRLPHLEREFAGVCAKGTKWPVPPPASGEEWSAFLRAAEDVELVLHLRYLLRYKAQQGMIVEWKRAHPEKGRIWRAIKARVKIMPSLAIRRDGRGWFVARPGADLRKPGLSREAVGDLLGGGCESVRAALDRLAGALGTSNGDGGYCVLTDLVQVYADLVARKLVFAGDGTGALPRSLGIRITSSGLPESVYVEKVRAGVADLARKYLDHDQERPAVNLCSGWPDAIVEVVVEMVCRKFEMGRAAWRHLSPEELAAALIPRIRPGDYEKTLQNRIDFTILRVRKELAERQKRPAPRRGGTS